MTGSLNRLEWLGIQLAFRGLLRLTHGEAAVLTYLVKKAPHPARYLELEMAARCSATHRVEPQSLDSANLTKVFLHRIRSRISMFVMHARLAGEDSGAGFKIEAVRSSGYRMSAADAAALIEVAKNHVAGCTEVAA